MKKFISFFVAFFFSCVMIFSESISPELLEKVKATGELQNVFLNNDEVKLSLVPNTELSALALTHWGNSEKPRLTTEKLFYLDKKTNDSSLQKLSNTAEGCQITSATNESSSVDLSSDSSSIEEVSKIIRSISTMKGAQYYSNRHKKWETLYHEAYLIKSPDDKTRIDDQTDGSSEGKILYCMQDDNSFGKCYYSLEYHERAIEVSVCFDNFEPLKFGFITAAKSHNIKINLVVVDEGDHFLVYLIVQAYYPKISMLEDKMIDSFNARVDSIYKWFVTQMNDGALRGKTGK